MKAFALVPILALCVLVASCARHDADQKYAEAFKRICTEYQTFANSLEAKPLPVTPGMSREEKLAALSKATSETADKFQALEDEQAALVAPEKFAGVQREAIAFYKVQADLWREWADAIGKDNREERDRISAQIDSATMDQFQRLAGEISKVAQENPDLQDRLSGIESQLRH